MTASFSLVFILIAAWALVMAGAMDAQQRYAPWAVSRDRKGQVTAIGVGALLFGWALAVWG